MRWCDDNMYVYVLHCCINAGKWALARSECLDCSFMQICWLVLIFASPLGSADLPGGGTGQPWRFVDGHLLVYTEGFYPIHRDSSGKISMMCLILRSNLQVLGILYHRHRLWHPSQTHKVKWNTIHTIIAIDIEVTWGQFQNLVPWWKDQSLTTASSNIGINWRSHTLQ